MNDLKQTYFMIYQERTEQFIQLQLLTELIQIAQLTRHRPR